jgi:hypothetical protein
VPQIQFEKDLLPDAAGLLPELLCFSMNLRFGDALDESALQSFA